MKMTKGRLRQIIAEEIVKFINKKQKLILKESKLNSEKLAALLREAAEKNSGSRQG